MPKEKGLGVIGCGSMGEILLRGVIGGSVVSTNDIHIYDIDSQKLSLVSAELGIVKTTSAEDLVNSTGIIILAVKPQDIEDLLKEIWHALDASKLLISIAAGTTIKRISGMLQEKVRIIRAMPNIAASVNKGITAISASEYAEESDIKLARKIFDAVGCVIKVEESMMDAVTAISGSGPAYFFYLAELLESSARKMGFGKEDARFLAVKTAIGSASLMDSFGADPTALRKNVTSKGGTTEAAFGVFEGGGLDRIVLDGVEAARRRSKELSGGN